MVNDKPAKVKSIQISEGIVLAIISGIAYMYVYLGQLGYNKYFDLPNYFIEVSLEEILFRILYLIIWVIMFIAVLLIYPNFIRMEKSESIEKLYEFTALVIVFSFSNVTLNNILNFFGMENRTFRFLTVGGYALLGVIAIIYFKFIRNWSQEERPDGEKNLELTLLSNRINLHKNYLYYVILLLLCLMVYSFTRSFVDAKNKEYYFVTNTVPEMVVLRSFGKTLICAPFDRETNIVERKFTTVEVKKELGIFASYEHLGRLKPAELSIPVDEAEVNQEEQEPPE